MKLFLITSAFTPIADFFANDGKVVALLIAQGQRIGGAIAAAGASVLPAISG